MRFTLSALALLVLLAGCSATTPNASVDDAEVATSNGATRAPCGDPCVATLLMDAEGIWQASAWLFWDDQHAHGPAAYVEQPDGSRVELVPGYRASRAWLEPQNGIYTLVAEAGIAVEYGWLVEETPTGDVLPNLVNLIPTDIHRETPRHEFQGDRIPVGDGCAAYEVIDDGAQRCLRLGNAIGNVGQGNLEVRLALQEGATGATGEGRFRQIVDRADGTTREALVGQATLHRAHQHWHYGGLQNFHLYEFDVATGTRGAEVNHGNKAGFCFEDRAPVGGHDGYVANGKYTAAYCAMVDQDLADWYFGVSPGWYDLYWSELSNQYVEITGAPDGTYELVASLGTNGLLEVTEWDNVASVVIDLQGKEVEVLQEFGWYRVSE